MFANLLSSRLLAYSTAREDAPNAKGHPLFFICLCTDSAMILVSEKESGIAGENIQSEDKESHGDDREVNKLFYPIDNFTITCLSLTRLKVE